MSPSHGEREQRHAERRFRATLYSIGDAVITTDAAGRVEVMNRVAEGLTGWPEAEARGRALSEVFRIVDEHGRAPMESPVDRVLRTGEVVGLANHTILVARDGVERPIADSGAPIRDEVGATVGVVLVFRDQTAERAAARALRDSEARYRTLFDESVDAIYVHGLEGEILDASRAAERQSGYTRDELTRRNVLDFNVNEMPVDVIKALWAAWTPGERHVVRTTHRRKDGSLYPVEVTTGRVRFEDQDLLLATTRDLTESERLQAQLLQAQKMEAIGRLAGGIAHDFNNTLGVILGNVELALSRLAPTDAVVGELREIRDAARRSAELTRQLLAFARLAPIAPRVLDLNATVAGMLAMLRRLIGEDIGLRWIPGDGVGPVRMDPIQIDQILANLCVNARDAIGGPGTVTISTGRCVVDAAAAEAEPDVPPGEYTQLCVSDDGCGISEAVRARLFEPFFSTKETGKGTGLGLATVHGIVEQNGGFIRVRSEPGRGSLFEILLPRCDDRPGSEPAAPEPGPRAPRGETILLVEDEPGVRRVSQRLLEDLGYVVLAAASPGEAIQLAEARGSEIDLLLTDVVMPGMNGRALARRLAGMCPGVRCLFVSGYPADVIAEQGSLEEGVHFLQKPFTGGELASKVRQVLGG